MKLYIRETTISPWLLADEGPEEHMADIAEEWRNQGYTEDQMKVEDE